MELNWIALRPSYRVPGILDGAGKPIVPVCSHVRKIRGTADWETDCDERALFIRTDEDGRAEYACAGHAR